MTKSIEGEAFGLEFVEFRRLWSILYYISTTEWKSYACIVYYVYCAIPVHRDTPTES